MYLEQDQKLDQFSYFTLAMRKLKRCSATFTISSQYMDFWDDSFQDVYKASEMACNKVTSLHFY